MTLHIILTLRLLAYMNKNKKEIKRSCKLLTLRERIDIERQYRYGVSITSIAKEIDRNKSTIKDISRVEHLINTRPRKRLSGLTPAEVFYQETGVALFS